MSNLSGIGPLPANGFKFRLASMTASPTLAATTALANREPIEFATLRGVASSGWETTVPSGNKISSICVHFL